MTPELAFDRSLVWVRRDLRLGDHAALFHAASRSKRVALAFNVDPGLLGNGRIGAAIVQAFFHALAALRERVRERGGDVIIETGAPEDVLPAIARRIGASAVFFNEDYEPDARERDARVAARLRGNGIEAVSSLDHVCLPYDAVRTDAGEPYKVYTPYARRWRETYRVAPVPPFRSEEAIAGVLMDRRDTGASEDVPRCERFGFEPLREAALTDEESARAVLQRFLNAGIARYGELRDRVDLDGTSGLSVALRCGTIGIRTCFAAAFRAAARSNARGAAVWIGELIWREFYQMILREFPEVASKPFRPAGERIAWRSSDGDLAAWCDGRTGYPIVDAAMRQLNTTGWMHNRLRMIVASFLAKHLLIDWRRGERYFETHLADADTAQNDGGWQWSASTGTDAAPYFRIFNPVLQSKKADPDGTFIRRMLPVLRNVPDEFVHEPWLMPPLVQAACSCTIGVDYPAPIVEHAPARERALRAYESAFTAITPEPKR